MERFFESKEGTYGRFMLAPMYFGKYEEKYLTNKATYVRGLTELKLGCTLDVFHAKWYQIAGPSHMRPSLCPAVSMLSRTAMTSFTKHHIKLARNTIKIATALEEGGLCKYELNKKSLQSTAYSDSSFVNWDNQSTQPGYEILMSNDTKRAIWLIFSSYEWPEVVSSVFDWRDYEFADCFDAAYAISTTYKISSTFMFSELSWYIREVCSRK